MKKLLFIIVLILVTNQVSQGQKLVSKISKEICECLEKYGDLQNQIEIEAAMESCIMKSSMKN